MPFSESSFKIAIDIFNQCASFTTTFVVPMALARIIYANISGSSESDYTAVAKGVVLYFVLIHTYEPILKMLFGIPETFGLSPHGIVKDAGESKASVISILPNWINWIMETLASVLFYIAVFLNVAFTVIMSAMAPVIFLLGAILGLGLGLRVFFGLLILVSSWPIVWVACDAIYNEALKTHPSKMGAGTFELIALSLKIAAPLALSFFGASSSHVGQAIAKTTTPALGFMKSSTGFTTRIAGRGASMGVRLAGPAASRALDRAMENHSPKLRAGLSKFRAARENLRGKLSPTSNSKSRFRKFPRK